MYIVQILVGSGGIKKNLYFKDVKNIIYMNYSIGAMLYITVFYYKNRFYYKTGAVARIFP